MSKQFTLGKNERLKSRKRIEQLFKTGKSFNLFPFRIYYLPGIPGTPSVGLQFGAGASTRNFNKAVDRNRVKRLTREAWRLQKGALQQKLIDEKKCLDVFFIYTARELPAYDLVSEKMNVALKKLEKIIDEGSPSHP